MSSFWRDKNVFITGISGFVGTNLAADLLAKGANLFGQAGGKTHLGPLKQLGILQDIETVYCDITQQKKLERFFAKRQIDICVHLAAKSQVFGFSEAEMYRTNILGTLALLELCRKKDARGFIFSSSVKAYGRQVADTVDEKALLTPITSYGVSKASGEMMCTAYNKTYGLPVAIARLSNVYGANEINLWRIVPNAICRILQNKGPRIDGNGRGTRDLLYITDALAALELLAEKVTEQKITGQAFNIASSKQTALIEIAEKLMEANGKWLESEFLPLKAPWINEPNFSVEKAAELLDWQPRVSLEKGLQLTFNWYAENRKIWQSKAKQLGI